MHVFRRIRHKMRIIDKGCAVRDLSQGRVVHGSDGPAGRVGSGRIGSGHDFAGFWQVGSGQHFGFLSFFTIISWFLNRYESSNTTFGFIVFLRYLMIHIINHAAIVYCSLLAT